jgi:hypothetical protein
MNSCKGVMVFCARAVSAYAALSAFAAANFSAFSALSAVNDAATIEHNV